MPDQQLFQNFDFRPHDANYQLEIKTSLTIKPGHLYMHVSPRKDVKIPVPSGGMPAPQGQEVEEKQSDTTQANANGPPLAIYYGM
jgi:cytochrome P450/NADPH-cytochrome P450 reductase